MSKKYTVEFLYDNGILEQYKTKEASEEEIERFAEILNESFKGGSKGTISMEDKNGNLANINILKITRFTVIK